MVNEINVFRGDTDTIYATVYDSENVLYDLTDHDVTLVVKNNNSETPLLEKTATVSVPTSGVATFSLTTTDTDFEPGKYKYGIIINKGTDIVKTVISSSFSVLEDYQ